MVCVCVSHSASIHKQSELLKYYLNTGHMLLTNTGMLSPFVVLKVVGSHVSPRKSYLATISHGVLVTVLAML